jgi:hypothetical protein
MKKSLTSVFFISLLVFALAGCKKDETTTCNLSTAVNRPPVAMNVTYVASQTGDGTISTLSYVTGGGVVTVENPTLPWTVTASVGADADVKITASGTVKNGSLKIEYAGTSGGATISGSDMCSHSSD